MTTLTLSHRSRKFLDLLPPKQFRQVVRRIFDLLEDIQPADSKQLAGYPFRRIDVGEYRIIYRVEETTVMVALIGKRNDDEVCRDLARL